MKWKTTSKRLPPEGTDVLCYWSPAAPGGKDCYGVATYAGSDRWHEPEDDEDDYRTPEFWMPLPTPPGDSSRG
jgi:hypothetical protein